jgi:rSAM/selenodomain-associated transferase 2
MNSNPRRISIIVPVLNEQELVKPLEHHIRRATTADGVLEIIFVDGGSSDSTVSRAAQLDALVLESGEGRAKQMNLGAQEARGDILYFLHADTLPPYGFDQAIINAVDAGTEAGCFRMKFDSNSRFLSFFAWFTRFNHWLCRGGDQSLFIKRSHFNDLRGFDENYRVYEDLEFIERLYRKNDFKVLPQYVVTSARKYNQVGKYRLQYHFAVIHLKNYLGASPEAIYAYYKRHILN